MVPRKVNPRDAVQIAKYGPGERSVTDESMRFSEYLDRMRQNSSEGELFVSENENSGLLEAVTSLIHHPGPERWFFRPDRQPEHRLLISVSAAERGLPMHVHGEAWLLQLRGAKRWYIYPSEANVSEIPSHWELFSTPPGKWPSELSRWVHSGEEGL